MSPKTITDWREDPDAEPAVDRKAIENYIDRTKIDPTDVDIETFIMIEECNTWFEEYKKILHRSNMKIELDSDLEAMGDLSEILRLKFKVKFVIIQTTEKIARLFIGYPHVREASQLLQKNEDSSFVGAGVVEEGFDIVWGSGTCEFKFGNDKPAENADEILAELKEAILQLVSKK